MKRIIDVLEKNGPMLSGKVADYLMDNFSVSDMAARKIISRAKAPVRKLNNVVFKNNQKFLYLDSHFGRPNFWDALIEDMRDSSKAYYYFVNAIINSNGFISINELPAYSSSPIQPLKGHKPADAIIGDLIRVGLLLDNDDGILQLNKQVDAPQDYSRFKSLELAKKLVMSDFYDWARKINLVAYGSAKLLDQTPEFGKLQWNYTAPSYINGLRKGSTPGFLVADIILGKEVLEEDIDYFMGKINIIRKMKNHVPFIPIFISERLDKKAFDRLKNDGVVLGFIDSLFGKGYLENLKSLMNVVEHAAAVIKKNPGKYFETMENVLKLEGKANNLKGDVFELAVGCYYAQTAPYIEINKLIYEFESGKRKEIDVFVKGASEVKFVECKGYNRTLDEAYVTKWLNENIPIIRKWALSQDEYKNKKMAFELWSTGGFEDSAKEKLKISSLKTKKYSIEYFEKKEIIDKARSTNNANLKRIMEKYF